MVLFWQPIKLIATRHAQAHLPRCVALEEDCRCTLLESRRYMHRQDLRQVTFRPIGNTQAASSRFTRELSKVVPQCQVWMNHKRRDFQKETSL